MMANFSSEILVRHGATFAHNLAHPIQGKDSKHGRKQNIIIEIRRGKF